DETFSRTEGTNLQSVLTDGLGSTMSLLDSAGAAQTEYTYEPFGHTKPVGAASGNSSKYTGREDDGTGLYYYRARYYSPTLQRFISEDPISFSGGDTNLYAYVGNDPINFVDPSGLCGIFSLQAASSPQSIPCTFNVNISGTGLTAYELGVAVREIQEIFGAAGFLIVFGNPSLANGGSVDL